MEIKFYKAGDIIHKQGDIANTLELITEGKVEIKAGTFSVVAKSKSILGMLEQANNPYSYDYVALEDITLNCYPYTRLSDSDAIVSDNFSECEELITATAGLVNSIASKYRNLLKATNRFYKSLNKSYESYKELCGIYHIDVQSFALLESIEPFVPLKDLPDWVGDYYDQLEIMPKDAKQYFYGTHTSLTTAAIWEAASHSRLFLSLCAQVLSYSTDLTDRFFNAPGGNLFDLYLNLYTKSKNSEKAKEILSEITNNTNDLIDTLENSIIIPEDLFATCVDAFRKSLNITVVEASDAEDGVQDDNTSAYDKISNSLETILNFAELDEAEKDRFRALISSYKKLSDKNSIEDDARRLRNEISKTFFDIYESCLVSSFAATKVPTILKMFFTFGYIDEMLIGKDNAVKLYNICEELNFSKESHIFTIYSWLKAIYDGEEDPSKNEFEQDFPAYLKSQKASGYITEEMEKRYLISPIERMRYEMQNFFRTGTKICTGRPLTFCPLLSEHNIIKPLETIIVNEEKITKNWNLIRSIDYSCFFRECSLQAPDFGLTREPIMLEVIPNIILMPVIGSRASLWQETSGVRRDTPARISMPIFADEDLLNMQIHLAGEFRWEMCKKIQGARWNDVTDHSLTSEYFNYLQFYKKNNELSAESKEKIKTAIGKCKNSFKNVFVMDYTTWIRYEALGSPRLNKAAKTIMFTYCPFAAGIREKLKSNPMFSNMIARHETQNEKKHKLMILRYNKIQAAYGKLPEEIEKYLNYFTL